MDPRLLAYVRQQRQARYSDEQIAEALRAQNYPDSLIQMALTSSAETSEQPHGLLEGYVRTYRQQGYSDTQIKTGLAAQGYSDSEINSAFNKTAPQVVKAHHSIALLLFPLLAIAILAAGYFLFIDIDKAVPPPVLPPDVGPTRLADILDNLIPLANRNPEAALALCMSIDEEDIPVCIRTVSQESSDPALCSQIVHDWTRDQCYLEFIYDEHLEYCDRLTLDENIRFCDNLKRFEVGTSA